MRRSTFVFGSLLALAPLLTGCGDGSEPTGSEGAPMHDLSFSGDATFHGAHGGQTLHVGVRRRDSGVLVASDQGPVSASAVPSFEFTFEGVLEEGESYDLEYWIDSNFGAGTAGVCDSPGIDHQWRIPVSSVSSDVTIDDTHRPAEVEDVCTGQGGQGTDPGY